MNYISLTIYKVVLILPEGLKKWAYPGKTTSAYMADKRHGDVYTVVSTNSKERKMKALITILFISLFFATDVLACECAPVSLERSYQSADFVILAKVGFVKDSLQKESRYMMYDESTPYWHKGGYNVVLQLDKVYKGSIAEDTIEITPEWTMCSQFFRKGQNYIVFGYISDNGIYTTNVCSGTFSTDKKDLLKTFNSINKK